MAIAKRKINLPVKPADLNKWILIGRAKLHAQIKAIKAIEQIEEGMAAKEAALSDTQDLAEELLYAEARLGEMLKNSSKGTFKKGGEISLPKGITAKQSHYAQELSKHEDSIARVVAKARESGDVPVRQQVLRDIQENKPKPETPELPKGKFNVIYADPPWEYDFSATTNREIENKYPTMKLEDIKSIKIPTLENAVLYLWATPPKLREALEVILAWGFEYKTNAVWNKEKIGMGYWFRGQHELLLVGTKGAVCPPPQKERISSVFSEKRGKHSQKPKIVADMIKSWHKGKRIDLFAREKREGWEAWGNEI